MALGATFWSTGGASALWHDMDSFTDGTIGAASGNLRELVTGPCKIYQEPSCVGGREGRAQNNPGYDSGFFYALETTSGVRITVDGVFPVGYSYSNSIDNGQYVRLQPYCIIGDLVPITVGTSLAAWIPRDAIYRTGFEKNYDASNLGHVYGTHSPSGLPNYGALSVWAENKTGTWRLWHYSPWAWSGSPPEVTAAAAMHAGLSADDIDQTAFDDAHDAYNHTTGDAPYTSLDEDWTIYARRTLGDKVSDFLLECAMHGRDLMFVNEAGKLSTSSWTNPTYTATGIDLADDQVMSVINWTYTRKHLFNAVEAGWGSAGRQSYEDNVNTPSVQSVSFEPNLESKPIDKWVHEDSNAASILKYGQVWLKGKKTLANFRGHPQEVELSHYPFLLTPHVTLSGSGYTWDVSTDGGGMVHVTYWLVSDSKPRAEITLKQGPIGFDLGIGDKITNLAVTGDGRTIPESRIIEREYNFDNMTMESLIMEVPPNT